MKFIDAWPMAVESLKANKMRAGLTILGVVIGVMAVIILVSLGEGAKDYIVGKIQGFGLGANTIVVAPGKTGNPSEPSKLTDSDVQKIAFRVKGIDQVAPEIEASGKFEFGKKNRYPYVVGATANYLDIVNFRVKQGRAFDEVDNASQKKVCLVGKTIVREIFNGLSPLGETIRLNGMKLTVIGVMEEKGYIMSFDYDDLVILPLTTAEALYNTKNLTGIVISIKDKNKIPEVVEDVKALLIREHRGVEDFKIMTQEEILKTVSGILGVLTFFVGGVAAISLLVGGIGIMNIMLVSVTERTREIGIRKAVGATHRDIFIQFLVESVTLSFLGGFVGMLLGVIFSLLGTRLAGLDASVTIWAIVVGTIFSLMVGIISGLYPAMRAARLDPIEALRYE